MVGLGRSLHREIDLRLALSRIGIVLVAPAPLRYLAAQGVADEELSALLLTDRVIPDAHGTTFEALRDVSPPLAARSESMIDDGLSMRNAAATVAAAAAAEGDKESRSPFPPVSRTRQDQRMAWRARS